MIRPREDSEYRCVNGAWVHDRTHVGDGVVLEPGAVVGPDVRVGRGSRIGANAVIYGPTVLGEENRLFPGVVLGGDPQDLSCPPGTGRLEVGDRNVFREYVTISRGSVKGAGVTRIGNDNYFMAGSHLGHDVLLEDRCMLANGVLIAGHCHVESDANFSGGSAIVQFSTVGRLAFIGGLAGARQDLEPFIIHDRQAGLSLARPYGINRVGLRRAHFSERAIDSLKIAYKVLFLRDLKTDLDRARDEIKRQGALSSEVEELIDFIERKRSGRFGRQLQAK